MSETIRLRNGRDITAPNCRNCGSSYMALSRQPNAYSAIFGCRANTKQCAVELLICAPADPAGPLVAYWSNECDEGQNLIAHARAKLGENASLYGFPAAVPG